MARIKFYNPVTKTWEYADKSINIGSGAISKGQVLYIPQELSEEEQKQARENIGAVSMENVEQYIEDTLLNGKW